MTSASINFILIESSLKFWFFVFEVILVILMLFLLRNHVKAKIKMASSLLNTKYIISSPFLLSLILLIFVMLKVYNVFTLILAIVTSFFTLGYVILYLIGFKALASPVEKLVLSFYLSIPVNCILFTFSLIFPEDWRATVLSSTYLALASLMAIKRKKLQTEQFTRNKHSISFSTMDVLALTIIAVFFIFSIVVTYPQMAYRPALDIIRHYSASLMVNESTTSYASPYPWFHFQLATIQLLSKQPMVIFQTALALLSIISILSFYIMAKAYLSDLNPRLPVISTIFWSLFSGFGWLYFLMQKLENANPSDYLALLGAANNKSYWDIGYGQGPWIWLWFRPLTLGVTGLFILLYLLKRRDLDRKCFMIVSYLALISIGMTHFSELVFYVMLLLAFSIFLPTATQIRIKETLNSSLMALLTILGFMFIYDVMDIKIKIPITNLAFLVAASILSILILKLKRFKLGSFSFPLRVRADSLPITYIIFGLSILWLATFLCWFFSTENFNVSMVSSVYGVPWLLYPVLLGICGLLTFPAIIYIVKHHLHHPVTVFIIIFFVGIVFGRLLTYINAYYVDSGYWERRFIPLVFFASCILASISTLHIASKIQSKTVLLSLMLSILITGGVTSTALSIEYQTLITSKVMLNIDELNQINLLKELSPSSYLLTFSWRSLKISEYVPFTWRIGYFRNHIWTATSPELVLNALFCNGNPATIYLTDEDCNQISSSSEYLKGYVMSHLLGPISPFFNDTSASIYYLEAVAPPAENSKAVLVVPENGADQRYLYAYDIMSSIGYNYTTSYISDIQTLSEAETIIVPNEKLASEILKLKNNLKLGFSKMIILNLDGYYGEFAKISYPLVNILLVSTDFGEAYLKDLIDQEKVVNVYGANFVPFVVEVRALNNSLILADDKATRSWEPSAGLSGNIGTPTLFDDSDEKVSGEDSLKIQVGNGSYAQWQLTWKFENTANLEAYDFISFYWYGRGDGTKYVIQVNTETPTKYFWYEFTDDWKGWKKVILPMHVADGSHMLYGVSFSKVTKNDATWHNIKSINFKLSGANLNIGGTFYMDRFAFEKAAIVTLKAEIHGMLESFHLLGLTSSTQTSIAELHDTCGTIVIHEYWLSDGTSTSEILGDEVGHVTLTEYNSTYSEATLKIKIPIAQENNETVQAAFGINPKFATNQVSTITVESKTLELPAKVKVTPFRTNANVIAYYGDAKAFFAIKSSLSGVDLTYLNFYPLIEAIENGSTTLHGKLGTIARMILGNLSVYTFQTEPINAGDTAAFKQAILQGNIAGKFDSIIVKIKDNESLSVIIDGQPVNLSENISSVCPIGFEKGTFNADYMRIVPGKGFYINATLQNVTLNLEGNQTRLILLFKDGSIYSVNGNTVTLKAKNLTVLLRKPQINVNGKGQFTDLYTYHDLNKRVRALGDNCEIEGRFIFTGVYGDAYTITKNFNYDGSVKLSKPIYGFDELKTLAETLPYLFIMTLCYITFVAMRIREKKGNE